MKLSGRCYREDTRGKMCVKSGFWGWLYLVGGSGEIYEKERDLVLFWSVLFRTIFFIFLTTRSQPEFPD